MPNSAAQGPNRAQAESAGQRLHSWKEIAAYLKVSERSVRRWERSEGLPVHRHLHQKRDAVFAYTDEIEIWWEGRRPHAAEQAKGPVASGVRWGLAGAAAVLALSVTGYLVGQRYWPSESPGRVMLAVLPFANLSGEPDQEYFSDGLTEEMISELGRLHPKQLGIIAHTSTMHYKGTEKRSDEIGRELAVDYIVEGSVRRGAGRVRVSAQLFHTSDQTLLWADSYERDMGDILGLQKEVAHAIANEIVSKLTTEEQTSLQSRQVNPEAYELYLKGRYFWNKRTDEGLKKAVEYFQQAIEEDPQYALAYAGLADTYILLGYYSTLSPHEAYPQAEIAARKALEIDEALGEAHSSLAGVFMDYRWNWPDVETEYKRALELHPGYPVAHQWYGNYLNAMGRSGEGIAELQRARELDPLSLIINTNLGWAYHLGREYDKALEEAHKALELDPNFYWTYLLMGRAYEQKGLHKEAIIAYERATVLSGNNSMVLAELGHAYARAGQQSEARKILARLKRPSGREYASPYDVALVCVGLGQKEEAFAWLEKSYQERARPLGFAKVEPRLDPLRSDPRFQHLLLRMNFPQ
ncbi:MAG: TPR end-of-group domain-containing protein [Candidatus Acidiferrales bacterium]